MQPTRFHKWVEIAAPDCPAEELAQQAFQSRLGAVQHYLPLAAEHYREDVEHVHQLRVWCRRAEAAVRTFADFVSAKRRKKTQRWLRQVRRSAGAARDDDVLLARLRGQQRYELTEMKLLVEQIEEHRERVQCSIIDVFQSADSNGVDRRLAGIVRRVGKRRKRSASSADFGGQTLLSLAAAFGQAAAECHGDLSDLHQLRIAGKRIRYAIEIFAAVSPKTLRNDVYPRLVNLQDELGEINDHAIAQLRYQRWIGQLPVGKSAALLADLILQEAEELEVSLGRLSETGRLAEAGKLQAELQSILLDKLD